MPDHSIWIRGCSSGRRCDATEDTIGLIGKSSGVEECGQWLIGVTVAKHQRPQAGNGYCPAVMTVSGPFEVANSVPFGAKMLIFPSPKLPISTSPASEPNPAGATAIPQGALSAPAVANRLTKLPLKSNTSTYPRPAPVVSSCIAASCFA